MPFLQYGSNTDVGDANAFRGTLADFLAFIGQPSQEEEDMLPYFLSAADNPSIYLVTGATAPSGKIAAFGLSQDNWNAHKALNLKSVVLPTTAALGAMYDTAPQPWPAGSGDGGIIVGSPAAYSISLSGSLSGSATPQS